MASVRKPYVAVCDGITMGGGVGLIAGAPFRVATEKTKFAMPETKIGYSPDVGSNYFLSRLDGAVGTYLALTGSILEGRAVFEHGIATHFVPSRRIPELLSRLASLDEPTPQRINDTIEEHYCDAEGAATSSTFVGEKRDALDRAFTHKQVEDIIASLQDYSAGNNQDIATWASKTLEDLEARSPTSLRIALEAVRRGRVANLREVLDMELGIAGAFCTGASQDFITGVTAVLITKTKERPAWSPSTLAEVSYEDVMSKFFSSSSPYLAPLPKLSYPERDSWEPETFARYTLPSEEDIEKFARGSHPDSGALAVNFQDVVEKFVESTNGKHGVKEKVREVLARRCGIAEN